MNRIKYRYEIRQVDGWLYPDGWTYNETWHICEFATAAKNTAAAFRNALAKQGISLYPHKTECVFDGDFYEIVNRKTKEPLFVAVPLDD